MQTRKANIQAYNRNKNHWLLLLVANHQNFVENFEQSIEWIIHFGLFSDHMFEMKFGRNKLFGPILNFDEKYSKESLKAVNL